MTKEIKMAVVCGLILCLSGTSVLAGTVCERKKGFVAKSCKTNSGTITGSVLYQKKVKVGKDAVTYKGIVSKTASGRFRGYVNETKKIERTLNSVDSQMEKMYYVKANEFTYGKLIIDKSTYDGSILLYADE